MKYLKISLRKSTTSNEIVYPVNYQPEIGNYALDHLYYEDGLDLKLLLCIPDVDFNAGMIRADVVEISETDAKAISEAKETRTETIEDEAKLRRLELKATLGMSLTTEELDSIDPVKDNSVFSVSKILADRVEELKTKELGEIVIKEIK